MKKILLSGFCVLLTACSANVYDDTCHCEEQTFYYNDLEYVSNCVFENEQNVARFEDDVEVDPCKCINTSPLREVLRPRIKVIVQEKPRRNCPADRQVINSGCGDCQVELQSSKVKNEVKEVIPPMPEAYTLAASRIFNRFIKDTVAVYSAKPNVLLYIKSAEVKSADLPDGVVEGVNSFKSKLLTSFTYAITDDENNNDYYLETSVDWFDTMSKTVPAIKYTVVLYDKNGNIVDTWVEIVKKAENSETWL